MALTLIVACGLMLAGGETTDRSDVLAEHARLESQAGRGADAQVTLALWCEAQGLAAERLKHLNRAVEIDPRHAKARGLLGTVDYQGQWRRPADIARAVHDDAALSARLAEYNRRRARTADTAAAQWSLALWCEQNGLEAEARAHLGAVVRLDPTREAAWKHLGCKKIGGRWVSAEQIAADKAEAEVQKAADLVWKPRLAGLLKDLQGTDASRRDQAEEQLATITDPRAVPAVWAVFVVGPKPDRLRSVQLLGQIDAVSASRALACLALFAPSAEIRRAARETLKRRDLREFVPDLIAQLRDPIEYDLNPVGGPGLPGSLLVKGQGVNRMRLYSPPPLVIQRSEPGQFIGINGYGNPTVGLMRDGWMLATGGESFHPGPSNAIARTEYFRIKGEMRFAVMAREIEKAAAVASRQLRNDAAAIDDQNNRRRRDNEAVAAVLREVTDQSIGGDRDGWTQWYANQIGYQAQRTEMPVSRTVVEEVPIAYQPAKALDVEYRPNVGYVLKSCFGAGTLVRTLDGSRPIERIAVGDQVLTQSTTSGKLEYRAVTAVHHNPPSPTFLVKLKDDTIVASPFHRFWVVGRGWVMARDLKPAQTLRLLEGSAEVRSVADGPVQPVYNLDVADVHDFFAGAVATLVHDNTLPDTRLTPFDAIVATNDRAR